MFQHRVELSREEIEHLESVNKLYRNSLLSLPNVNGVGIGYKVVAGETIPLLSISVHVIEKKSLDDLTETERVPREIHGIPTDVVEIGEMHLLAYTARERPALGGTAISDTIGGGGGTLGARFIDNTDRTGVILSNNHVISSSDDVVRNIGVVGTKIVQPWFSGEVNTIATLKRWVKYVLPPSFNRVDGAIAEIVGPLMASARIHDVGRYDGWKRLGIVDLLTQVQKTGATTEYTLGTVVAVLYASVVVNPSVTGGVVLFQDQIAISLGPSFASSGDSGSVVLDMQEQLVGLLFSVGLVVAIANSIDNVLSELDISVCPRC